MGDTRFCEKNGSVVFEAEDDFDLKKIFGCGQCFRWNEEADGAYSGVALGRAARIRQEGSSVSITGTAEDFRSVWSGYFDLGRSYAEARRALCTDGYLKAASDFGAGIRILNQDRWETLCSFILSQCNNIPRIKKIIEALCGAFGAETELEGRSFCTFPDAGTVARLSEAELAPLRAGYRAPYLLAAARAVDSGALDLEALARGDADAAKRALTALPGIGGKVADCVLLFSLRVPRAFPMDVWIKKAVAEHYPDGLDPAVFGDNAGLAQQYMYYYQREGGAALDTCAAG